MFLAQSFPLDIVLCSHRTLYKVLPAWAFLPQQKWEELNFLTRFLISMAVQFQNVAAIQWHGFDVGCWHAVAARQTLLQNNSYSIQTFFFGVWGVVGGGGLS